MPTRSLTPTRLAKELAAITRQLGNGTAVAKAVFGQLLTGGDKQLRGKIERLPDDALRRVDELSALARRDELFSHIDQQQQPVLPAGYLLELFLREVNGGQRRRRGAFFTPRPLVQFIVRAVSELIEEHFRGRASACD